MDLIFAIFEFKLFIVCLPDDFDPDRDDPDEEGKCSVVLGLMQEYRRVGKSEGLQNLHIGMTIYKVSDALLV